MQIRINSDTYLGATAGITVAATVDRGIDCVGYRVRGSDLIAEGIDASINPEWLYFLNTDDVTLIKGTKNMPKQTTYTYGFDAVDTNDNLIRHMITCDKELDLVSRDEFVSSLALCYGKSWTDVEAALYLYKNADGTPCQFDDLYDVSDGPTQAERMANLQALQDEADEECA